MKDKKTDSQQTIDEVYMKEALRQAKKAEKLEEVPIGCVIVYKGEVIARGYNRRNTDNNTLSHAELNAIKKASKRLGDWRLEGCTLYVTLEPCQMCAGAIVQSRIDRVVIGCMNLKAGSAGSVINLLRMPAFNHQSEITKGVLEDACSQMMSDFFKKLRRSQKIKYADANGVKLYYEKRGKGKPLFLLHGNGEDHHIFDKLSAKLENHFTVYAIDSRNHGMSEKTKDFSYQTMTDDIEAAIRQLADEPAYLIGFSDGAIIGLLLGMQAPNLLRKMILLGPNLNPGDFLPEVYQEIENSYEKTRNPLEHLMLTEPQIASDMLKDIKVPALVTEGSMDIFRPGSVRRIAEALAFGTYRRYEGKNHSDYVIDSKFLYKDVIGFFEIL